MRLLMTVPGVGWVLAYTIASKDRRHRQVRESLRSWPGTRGCARWSASQDRRTMPCPDAHFAELATPVRAKRPPWIGVLATPSEAASAADAGRPRHPLILTSFRSMTGLVAG